MEITVVSLRGLDFDRIKFRLLRLPDFVADDMSSSNLAGDFVLHLLFGSGDRNFPQKSALLSFVFFGVADLDLCFEGLVGTMKCPMHVKAATSKAANADLVECFVSVSTYITAQI